MDIQELHAQNREAWDAAAIAYEKQIEADIEFLRRGGKNFCPPEFSFLDGLEDWCNRAIHLQCAGGTDTLSLWNHGAHEVVGVDISERMIGCGRRKSAALNAPATWHACDVLNTPNELDGTADLVYTGRGALCWVHDLDAWAAVVHRLLKPGGRLYIYEGHPVTWVWDEETDHLKLSEEWGDYFHKGQLSSEGWPDTYMTEEELGGKAQPTKYETHRTVAQLINPILGAGLQLDRLEEHPDEFYDAFPNLPTEIKQRLPNTISLLISKP
jgi:SAM-dependent methyltransferase